jgi:hypothetical protein
MHWIMQLCCGCLLLLGCCAASPTPPTPPTPPIPAASSAAETALRDYVRDVAENFAQLSREKFSTVEQAMERNVALDRVARDKYAAALKTILEPRLGNTNFPAEGSQLFSEMSRGFKEVAP